MSDQLPAWAGRERVDDPIYRVEEITVAPGERARFAQRLSDEYLPAVERQGCDLLHVWVDPPIEVADRPTHFIVSWRIDGTHGFWSAKRVAAGEASLEAFWASMGPSVSERRMRFARTFPGLDPTDRVSP